MSVVEGGKDVTTALLRERFDHIFFTGGAVVAKIVMAAAAHHLTPVTLELGGKCPAIVSDGDLRAIARRLAFGKVLNAGQTCVAPDYLLVTRPNVEPLLRHLREVLVEFYGTDVADSRDYGRIINEAHFDRLTGYLEGVDVVIGGRSDRARLTIEPTVVMAPPPTSPLMSEEIFGPILPIIPIDDVGAALCYIREHPAPLAAYVFTERADVRNAVESRVQAGAIGINICAAHLAVPGLPFGGVGASGMGAYHGKHSFDTFSQLRPVFSKSTRLDTLRVAYPPYSAAKSALLRRL